MPDQATAPSSMPMSKDAREQVAVLAEDAVIAAERLHEIEDVSDMTAETVGLMLWVMRSQCDKIEDLLRSEQGR